MRKLFFLLFPLLSLSTMTPAPPPFDPSSEAIVSAYVDRMHSQVFREPKGRLRFPYLVPSGPYNQLWDWDSYFMGTGLLTRGSAPYLLGSARNFLAAVDLATGKVPGCLTPDGPSPTLVQAKPVLVQMLVQGGMGGNAPFNWTSLESHRPAIEAFLHYWDVGRADPGGSGLSVWYNQMESGADNLPISKPGDVLTVASADLATFLYREHRAFAFLLSEWGDAEAAAVEAGKARAMAAAAMRHLYDAPSLGFFAALNTTTRAPIANRVFLMAFPLFAGPDFLTGDGGHQPSAVAASCASQVSRADMLSDFGLRSTSSLDPAYNNRNMIVPDSNWQGPVWIVSNAAIAYGLSELGHGVLALAIARRVVTTLAADLNETGAWHECYDSAAEGDPGRGRGLAAEGFLSWNVLGADLLKNLVAGVNPFALPKV